jgi:hypothetical protein
MLMPACQHNNNTHLLKVHEQLQDVRGHAQLQRADIHIHILHSLIRLHRHMHIAGLQDAGGHLLLLLLLHWCCLHGLILGRMRLLLASDSVC